MKAECFPGSDIAAPSLRGMSSTERLSFPAALLAGAQQGCVLQVQLRAPDGHIPQDVGLEFIEPRMGGLEGTLKVIETWDHGMVGLGWVTLGWVTRGWVGFCWVGMSSVGLG